ncbi:MAG: hypothetical protein M3155_03855 [Actinomycetota bacterium]|nr:hypothetical protein [Actinomycetota bacterium]
MRAAAARRPAAISLSRVTTLGLIALPLIFGVPILLALTQSIVDAAGQAHPFFADISGATTDARALGLGSPIYQDPAAGYTPLVYTPLMSLLGAGLDQVADWDGWTLILTMLADVALIALGAHLAWSGSARSGAERTAALAGAVGVGAMAFWLMTFVPFNFAFSPRPDQLSWAFALLGLAAIPGAAAGSRRAQVAAVVLLSAAFWTKQTSVPALLAAVVWLVLAAARGRARPATAVWLTLALVAVNGVALGALDLLTDGWAWRFIVDLPARRARVATTLHSIGDFFESVGVPLAVAATAWGAAVIARRRGSEWPARTVAVASVLAVFVVVDAPLAMWFREAQGAVHNMYVGIGWTCGLLFAAGWGIARTRLPSLLIVASLVAGLFVVSESSRLESTARHLLRAHVPPKSLRAWPGFLPPNLLRYAEHHLVYHPAYPGIGVHRRADLYPGSDNIEALLWSGEQPRHLVDAFLQRRFDLVYLFENDGYRGDADGYGPWEENYFWKLNEVIKAKYRPATGALRRLRLAGLVFVPVAPFYSPYIFERRPGPDPASWMSRCFGPFHLPGATLRIARGGGFWCRTAPGSPTLRLVATPALLSEVRDDHFRAAHGAGVALRLARAGTVDVSLGSWHSSARVPAGGRALIRLPGGAAGALSIVAPGRSGAEVQLVGPAAPARR